MFKKMFSVLLILIIILFTAAQVSAVTFMEKKYINNSVISKNYDYRIYVLKNYFDKHNSPLAPYSREFVETADKYDLDWRLVPAITGVESTFGKNIPSNSYNAYGWANGRYSFSSWEDSIEIVSKTLKEKYIDNGAIGINDIARIYAPPSSTWAWKVKYFMNEIDPMPVTFSLI